MVTKSQSQPLILSKSVEAPLLLLESTSESQSHMSLAKTSLHRTKPFNFASNSSTTINLNTKSEKFRAIMPFNSMISGDKFSPKFTLQSSRTNNAKLRNFLLACRFNDIEPDLMSNNLGFAKLKKRLISVVSNDLNSVGNFCQIDDNKKCNSDRMRIPNSGIAASDNIKAKVHAHVSLNKNKSNFQIFHKENQGKEGIIKYNFLSLDHNHSFLFKAKEVNKKEHSKVLPNDVISNSFLKTRLVSPLEIQDIRQANESKFNSLPVLRNTNPIDITKQLYCPNTKLLSYFESQIQNKLTLLQKELNKKKRRLKVKYLVIKPLSPEITIYPFLFDHSNSLSDLFKAYQCSITTYYGLIDFIDNPPSSSLIVLPQMINYIIKAYLEISHGYISEVLFNDPRQKNRLTYRRNKSTFNVKLSCVYPMDRENIIFSQHFIFLDYLDRVNKYLNDEEDSSSSERIAVRKNFRRAKTQRFDYKKQMNRGCYTNLSLLRNPSFFKTIRRRNDN